MVHTDQTVRRNVSTFTTVKTPTSPSPTDAASFATGAKRFSRISRLLLQRSECYPASETVRNYTSSHRSCHKWRKGFAFKWTQYYHYFSRSYAGIQSAQRFSTGWTVRRSKPRWEWRGAAKFTLRVQTGPGVYTVSCTMGTGSLSKEVKRPGRDVYHPPPSRAKGKERVITACCMVNFNVFKEKF
jgi:hypothetical protein